MKHYVGCLILTSDNRILLQQRGDDWTHHPGFLSEFGGAIESGETPLAALIRELNEELGASVNSCDVVELGLMIDKSVRNDCELVFGFFWHDKMGAITGCYEGESRLFASTAAVREHPKVMGSVIWLLGECQQRKLIKS